MSYPILSLKSKHDFRINKGHPWVFSNEVQEILAIENGSIVEIQNSKGFSYGNALYNSNSLIIARLLNTKNEIDCDFFIKRINHALTLRLQTYANKNTYRLVYSESDLLPGLIIDKYEDYFVLQIASLGMELFKQFILDALLKIFPNTKGIISKNESILRSRENLPLYEKVEYGKIPETITISENNITYQISLIDGQKTGYFLDQVLNRSFVQKISKNLTVLDCFTNQGGFALNAGLGEAKNVLGIDISEQAIKFCKNNAFINNLKQVEFEKADVFNYLKQIKKNQFDMIILDPPSFGKSKKDVPNAKRAYAEINRLALASLGVGSYLVSSSCTMYIYEEIFKEIIEQEAIKLKKKLQLIYRGMQAADHPILASMPETNYLKFFVYRIAE